MLPTTPNLGIAIFDKKKTAGDDGEKWKNHHPPPEKKIMGFSTTPPFSRPCPKAGATQLDLFILPPSLDA